MGLPKGTNNGNHGKKGRSGRKSLKQEVVELDFLDNCLNKAYKKAEIEKRIKSGEFNGRDVFLFKILTGNDKALKTLMDKLFANKQAIQMDIGRTPEIEEALNQINKLSNESRSNKNNVQGGGKTTGNTAKISRDVGGDIHKKPSKGKCDSTDTGRKKSDNSKRGDIGGGKHKSKIHNNSSKRKKS